MHTCNKPSENDRRNFLRLGTLGALMMAAGGGGVCSCSSGSSSGEGADSGDTIKLLTPEGELVEVDKVHIHHPYNLKPVSGKKCVRVIDLARCNNARKCVEGCQKMHYLPEDKEWLSVKLMKDSEGAAPYWFPKTCFHCDNPPCVKVCPVDATFKRQDGLVLIDSHRCIGCKFCMTACPYSTRVFNWAETEVPDSEEGSNTAEWNVPHQPGTVEKCDFCPDMARAGMLPDCVTACPNGVFYFGDENEDVVTNGEETVRFTQLIKDRSGYRYMEDLGTQPRVYYLPPRDRLFPVERGYESLPEDIKERYKDVGIDG